MKTIILYHFPPSAQSRFALLVAKTLQLDVDVKIIDLYKNEQFNPDFIQINPQHTVPTLVDGDFVLWESQAISTYLVRKYGKDDSLYPENPKKKAIIDQRMQFDVDIFYPKIRSIIFPVIFLGDIIVSDEKKAEVNEIFLLLNTFLEGRDYMAGNNLTIADYALITNVTSFKAIGWETTPYVNVQSWVKRCASQIPHYSEINLAGADHLAKEFKSKLPSGKM